MSPTSLDIFDKVAAVICMAVMIPFILIKLRAQNWRNEKAGSDE